ncbi:MAG: hypothetical protein GX996_05080 [Firmicutes bacterium]|nr:hypothetical protein [Bacillota bacterium]
MLKKASDVTAYRLDEAINILKEEGIKFGLSGTAPAFSKLPAGSVEKSLYKDCRVVKQIELPNGTVKLIVAVAK